MLRIATNRMVNRVQVKLNVALRYAQFKNVTEPSVLRNIIRNEADQEAAKASTIIGSALR